MKSMAATEIRRAERHNDPTLSRRYVATANITLKHLRCTGPEVTRNPDSH